jgi:hypothetical protein
MLLASDELDMLIVAITMATGEAVEAGDNLLSLDINPVTVLEQGRGAKILDGVLVGHKLVEGSKKLSALTSKLSDYKGSY